MNNKAVLFVLCLVIWAGLNLNCGWEWLACGAVVSLIIAMLMGDMFFQRPHLAVHAGRYVWLLYYFMLVFCEAVKAGIDCVYRLIRPDISLNQGIVKIKTDIKSETGLLLLANSVTVSTGICVMDIDAENGYLYVYGICAESENIKSCSERISARFEKIIKKIVE